VYQQTVGYYDYCLCLFRNFRPCRLGPFCFPIHSSFFFRSCCYISAMLPAIYRDELPGWRIGDSACSGLLMLLGSGSVLCPVGAPPDGPSRQCPERASGLASRPNQTGVCAADLDHEMPALRHMLEEHLQHRWTLAS
jgi:hypothetical protein